MQEQWQRTRICSMHRVEFKLCRYENYLNHHSNIQTLLLVCYVEYIVEHGADVNVPDKCGRMPLNAATDERIKRFLRAHGASWKK